MPRRNHEAKLAYNREYRRRNPDRTRKWEQKKWQRIKATPKLLTRQRIRSAKIMRRKRLDPKFRAKERTYALSPAGRACQKRSNKKYYLANRGKCIKAVMASRKRTGYNYWQAHPGKIVSYLRTSTARWHSMKTGAKQRGLKCEISKEDFSQLLKRPCCYCGIGLSSFSGSGLDRLDFSKGYTLTNVVPCCPFCNRVRSNVLSHDEMLIAMKAVLNYRKKII